MAEITGFTADRMKQIEDNAIVDGRVEGDDLILVTHEGTEINAGSVRGPQGIQGPGGGDISDVMDLLSPIGTVHSYAGASAPTGWLLCDGASLLRASYPALFGVLGTAYGSVDSDHFNIPDLRQRVPLGKAASGTGSTLGGTGGTKDSVVVSHTHSHSHVISSDGVHKHGIAGDKGLRLVVTAGGTQTNHLGTGTGAGITVSTMDNDGNHDHGGATAVNAAAASGGVAGTDQNLPPYVVLNYIIRY